MSDELPQRFVVAVVTVVTAVLLAGGVLVYRVVQPCWPWQEVTSVAGGTFCDGEPARFDTD